LDFARLKINEDRSNAAQMLQKAKSIKFETNSLQTLAFFEKPFLQLAA
jgi:hypothetical protein